MHYKASDAAQNTIRIDHRTGVGRFHLPIASFMDLGHGPAFTLELGCGLKSARPCLNLLEYGKWRLVGGAHIGTGTEVKVGVDFTNLPLYDSRSIDIFVGHNHRGRVSGASYGLDASTFFKKKSQAGHANFYTKEVSQQFISVMHKNGIAQVFQVIGSGNNSGECNVYMTELLLPTGQGLKFTWASPKDCPRLVGISDSAGELLSATWDRSSDEPELDKLVLFPGSNEQVTYTFTREDEATQIEILGVDPLAQKLIYRIEGSDKKVSKVTSTTIYADAFERVLSEQLAYTGNKVKHYTTTSPECTDGLMLTSTYAQNKTTVVATRGEETTARSTEIYEFDNGRLCKQSSLIGETTSTTEFNLTADYQKMLVTLQVVSKVDGVTVDESTTTFNNEGNLLSVERGNEVTEWTYFNNYAKYSVDETLQREYVLEGIRSVLTLFDYTLPGAVYKLTTGKALTWGYSTHFDVDLSYSTNDYAKDAFNLPVEVKYPGDVLGFSTHVESERKYHKDGEKEVTSTITYFGYETFPCVKHPFVDRKHWVVPALKLTVFEPEFETVDISATQLKLAQQGATAFKEALERTRDRQSTQEDKHAVQVQIDGLIESIKHQSKLNGQGFRLSNWAAGKMQVEQLSYHLRPSDAGFGRVKSSSVYWLDELGKKIDTSETSTTFTYSTNNTDKRGATIQTQVKSSDGLEATSSRTHAGLSSRLLESIDSEGFKTAYSQAGSTWSETVTRADEQLSSLSSSHSINAEARQHRFIIDSSEGSQYLVVFNERGQEIECFKRYCTSLVVKEISPDAPDATKVLSRLTENLNYFSNGYFNDKQLLIASIDTLFWIDSYVTFNEPTDAYITYNAREDYSVITEDQSLFDHFLQLMRGLEKDLEGGWLCLSQTSYDALGRKSDFTEYDYSPCGSRCNTRKTIWIYDDSTSACTETVVWKDANDKIISTLSETLTVNADSTQRVRGKFKHLSQYDTQTRTFIETFGPEGKDKANLRKRTVFSETGLIESLSTGSITGNTETELGNLSFTHDSSGRLKSMTANGGAATTYGYDHLGRLTQQSHNGITITNQYGGLHLNAVATAASVKDNSAKDAKAITLGSQSLDGFSRVKERTVNGAKRSFSYEGMSSSSKSPATAKVPKLAGYGAEWHEQSLTYTETCNNSASKAEYSLAGQVLSFTDILGNTSVFTYDALGRLTHSTSEACESTFSYADSGLLDKETIKDLSTGMTMTVAYQFDVMGNETKREFTCPGLSTLSIERSLNEGRLQKSVLKVNAMERRSDSYTYDANGRLSNWSCTGEDAPSTCTEQAFTYDVLGNVISTQFKNSTGVSSSSYRYAETQPGALINSSGAAHVNDSAGRTIQRGAQKLTYHDNGQIKTYSSEGERTGESYTFNYDDQGRIRGTTLGKRSDVYHYRLGSIYALEQIDDAGNDYYRRRLTLLNSSPACLLQNIATTNDKRGDTLAESRSFELRDAAGTVFASYDLASNTITYYTYLPYGYRVRDEKAVTWLGFKGEPMNPLGLYHLGNGYRLYDPQLHRFQTPDSLSPFGAGGPAAYVYCSGDPVNYHDPSGHHQVAQFSYWDRDPGIASKEVRIALAVTGVLLAPFTGGGALAAVAATGLTTVAAGFDIASILLEDSDPEMSSNLAVLGFGLGLTSAAAAIAMSAPARGAKAALTSQNAERLAAYGDMHLNVQTSRVPLGSWRRPAWYQETVQGAKGPRHFWGADQAISKVDIADPLISIGRRNSTSSIHIESGVHGRASGNNWTSTPAGNIVRDPHLDELSFFTGDVRKFEKSAWELKSMVSRTKLQSYNTAHAKNSYFMAITYRLAKRNVHVHNIRSMSEAALTSLEEAPGHHIGAFCYSRNDERWLYTYNLQPVTSYRS